MKKLIYRSKNLNWLLSALIVFSLASCSKTNSTGFTPGTGAPTITSVHTLSKSDTSKTPQSTTTVDASGNIVTTVSNTYVINPAAFDSLTNTGNKQNYYVIYGSNLGSTTEVMFNGYVAYFNRALITDKSIIVAIPLAVPTTGAAATNKITVVTTHGKVDYGFTTLTPPPTIATISDYDFWTGSKITLTGIGFGTVTGVTLTGSTAPIAISDQTDSQITLTFPSIVVNSGNLVFSYSSAGKTATETTKEVFNNLDNAYQIFVNNAFQNAWGDASWSAPSGVSTATSHSGSSSIVATYPAGGWKVEGWANWYPSFPYDASYNYVSFWVKGGTVSETLVLVGDQMVGGYGQTKWFGDGNSAYAAQTLTIPPNVWTFFKIPLGTGPNTTDINYWANGTTAKQLGFFLQGGTHGSAGDVDETMYFDEVAFLK
jgi:hypothetical protein